MAITWKKIAYEDDCLLEADLTSKGDLLSASAAGTLEVLGVGANGQALVAASGEASGLDWAAPSPAEHGMISQLHTVSDAVDGDFIHIEAVESVLTSVYRSPAEVAERLNLDDIGTPVNAVDFNLQQATDLVVMTVANEAALPITGIAIGQLCWATSELSFHICTAIE